MAEYSDLNAIRAEGMEQSIQYVRRETMRA